jgi:hypothetical protein
LFAFPVEMMFQKNSTTLKRTVKQWPTFTNILLNVNIFPKEALAKVSKIYNFCIYSVCCSLELSGHDSPRPDDAHLPGHRKYHGVKGGRFCTLELYAPVIPSDPRPDPEASAIRNFR